MLALSSTSASVTWVRPLEATLSSMRLRMKRRIRNGLRFILRSASGSQVISLVSDIHGLLRWLAEELYPPPISLAVLRLRRPVDGCHVLLAVPGLYRFVEAGRDGLGYGHPQVVGFGGAEDEAGVFTRE